MNGHGNSEHEANPTRKDGARRLLHLDVWLDLDARTCGANWDSKDFPNYEFILMVLYGAQQAVEATKRVALMQKMQQAALSGSEHKAVTEMLRRRQEGERL